MFKKGFILIILIIISLTTVACNNVSNKNDETITKKENHTQNWKESPLFESGNHTMLGEEGRLGFSYDDGEILRFYPDKTQKYIWYFWGEEQEFDGALKFIGTHENDEKQKVVYGGEFYKANNKADRQVHTSMNLPKSGMWRLDAYIGDKLFGTVYVKVHKK
ncbi:hypothetical protein [Paenisporosarcina sp. OV554]|uniref:hypothetical protein n=1 Tax=Paenisporosarcina sp. OV554 TaxID=2135694 RepID=UPI000D384FA4|nr:hypothetical protein [Paenisporosarcina sp. OV554]PUB05905.1 hypothetical protein C8K15_1506 [Paenisporosarcina sp. OV554]